MFHLVAGESERERGRKFIRGLNGTKHNMNKTFGFSSVKAVVRWRVSLQDHLCLIAPNSQITLRHIICKRWSVNSSGSEQNLMWALPSPPHTTPCKCLVVGFDRDPWAEGITYWTMRVWNTRIRLRFGLNMRQAWFQEVTFAQVNLLGSSFYALQI